MKESAVKERINLVVSKQTRDKIEELQKRLDLGSISEVIRRGVSVLDVLSKYEENGSVILMRGDGTEVQLQLL
jgi:hypothetical protein